MTPLITPSRKYYLLPVLFLLIGGLSAFQFFQGRMAQVTAALDRGVAPGSREIHLPRSGHHSIFLEYRSILDGGMFLTRNDLGGLRCAVVSGSTGRPVRLHRPWVPLSYSQDDRAGVLVFDFWVEAPGAYELRTHYPQEKPGPQLVLAVGEGLLGDLSGTVLGGLSITLGSVVLGLAAVWLVYRGRARSIRRVYGRFGR